MSPPPRPRRTLLLVAVLALAAALATWAFRRASGGPPRRVFMRVEAGEGLGEAQRAGLESLLLHQVEALGDLPALRWVSGRRLPEIPDGTRFLRIRARRRGDALGLDLAWSEGPDGETGRAEFAPAAPDAALRRILASAPLNLRPARPGQAWPRAEGTCWKLVESMGLIDLRSEAGRALELARTAAAEAPEASEAQVNLGIQLYSELQWNPGRDPELLNLAVASFEAGLAAQPGHPRGARDLAVMLTDTGRSREALEGLARTLPRHPRAPRLYEALAYASRTAGLLEVSRRAIRAQHRLALDQTRQVAETTLLYLEDWPAFLATCAPGGGPADAKAWFYRGYVALARGDRDGALAAFRAATRVPEGWYGFEDLAAVLARHLEGREAEARARLDTLARARVGLRIPDGEFTFKLAEANALLGRPGEAMDLASSAFAQGFCCVRWYERSPFMGPVRTQPRWEGLLQHARERQALLGGAIHAGPLRAVTSIPGAVRQAPRAL